MAINAKITKAQPATGSDSERLFKLLESIDWKLWEMYQMMKAQTDSTKPAGKTTKAKPAEGKE